MAYVRQQGAALAATSSTTIATTLAQTLVAGNTIVVIVSTGGTPVFQSIGAVTGITWSTVVAAFNSASNSSIGAVVGTCTADVAAGTTITATLSAADTRRTITIEEFSGRDTTGGVVLANAQASGAAGTDATPTTGALSGSNIDLVSGNAMNSATVTMNPPTGFTETRDQANTSKNITVAYREAQGAGTYTPFHTVATGTRAAAEGLVVALKAGAPKSLPPVAPRRRAMSALIVR